MFFLKLIETTHLKRSLLAILQKALKKCCHFGNYTNWVLEVHSPLLETIHCLFNHSIGSVRFWCHQIVYREWKHGRSRKWRNLHLLGTCNHLMLGLGQQIGRKQHTFSSVKSLCQYVQFQWILFVNMTLIIFFISELVNDSFMEITPLSVYGSPLWEATPTKHISPTHRGGDGWRWPSCE